MTELEEFFDYLYGNQTGFAYSPVKTPGSAEFVQHFFKWPEERDKLIAHVRRWADTREVYTSPGLFSVDKALKETFKGSNVVWVEFDGTTPADMQGIPSPTLKIQSSTDRHEHWYWKLEGFVNNSDTVENVTQRLAYALGADLACWNANRVLRPPTSKHHESGLEVTILNWEDREHRVPILDFTGLPQVPVKMLDEGDIKAIPEPAWVIAKYPFKDRQDDFDFFMMPTIEKGGRSDALAKLGHICMEMGMSNAETLSLLYHADNRWGKYKHRTDRKRILLGIINHCRSRHPIEPIKPSVLQVFTYDEFMNTEIKLEWVVPGLVHKRGLICVAGPPQVGKSQFSLRFAEKMATGTPFLKWEPSSPEKILFVSMEMQHEEVKHFLQSMNFQPNPLLRDNFLVMPLGQSIRLGSKRSQTELTKVMEEFQPTGIILDSYGVALGKNLKEEEVVFETLDYIHDVLRKQFGSFVWFIHHPRKSDGSTGRRKPQSLDDLYGNQYFGAALTACLHLWDEVGDGKAIEVDYLKLRLSKPENPFLIERTPNLDFKLLNRTDLPSDTPRKRGRRGGEPVLSILDPNGDGPDWRNL